MRFIPASFAFLLTIFGSVSVYGDSLQFPSGDLLQGNFIMIEEGTIVFDSYILGRIRVPENEVVLTRSGAPQGTAIRPVVTVIPVEVLNDITPAVTAEEAYHAPEIASIPAGNAPLVIETQATESPAETHDQAMETSVVYRILSYVNPLKGWSSKISLGYSWENTGVRSEDMTLMYDAERRGDGSDFKLAVRYEYGNRKSGESPEALSRDRFRGNLRYREDIGSRWFFHMDSDYQKDRIKNIKHEISQNTGIGWRVFNVQPLTATIVPKLSLRYREFDTHSEGWDFLVTISQDLRYQINPSIAIIQATSMAWNPDDFNRSSYTFSVRLENRITERVFVDLVYEQAFDYEVGVGAQSKSQRTNFLIGYKF